MCTGTSLSVTPKPPYPEPNGSKSPVLASVDTTTGSISFRVSKKQNATNAEATRSSATTCGHNRQRAVPARWAKR